MANANGMANAGAGGHCPDSASWCFSVVFFPSIGAEKSKLLRAGTLQHHLFITKEVKLWIIGFRDGFFSKLFFIPFAAYLPLSDDLQDHKFQTEGRLAEEHHSCNTKQSFLFLKKKKAVSFSSDGSTFSFHSAAEPFCDGWKEPLRISHPTSSLA